MYYDSHDDLASRLLTQEDVLYHPKFGCVSLSKCVNIALGKDDQTKIVPKVLFDEINDWAENGQVLLGNMES